jgi:hypothetical protein
MDKKPEKFNHSIVVPGPILPVTQLRIGKATYGTRLFLNGQLINEIAKN